jgi:hypothetical protein
MVFKILWHFLFKGELEHPYGHDIYTIRCPPDTRIKNMHGLEVGISTVFEILGHFLFKGGTGPSHMVMTYSVYTIRCSLTQVYIVLGWGSSIVFEIFNNFQFLGLGVDPRVISNVLHTCILPVPLDIRF